MRRLRASGRLLVTVVVVLAVIAAIPPASAGGDGIGVTEAGIREHLDALAAAALESGGSRAVNTPGYEASVGYVADRLTAAGLDVEVAEFTVGVPVRLGSPRFDRVAPSPRPFVEGTDFVQPEPPSVEPASGDVYVVSDGCDPAAFEGTPGGAIVLVTVSQACEGFLPVVNADNVGASGVLFGAAGGPGVPPADLELFGAPQHLGLPTLSLSGDARAELAALAAFGPVTVEIDTGWTLSDVATWNVLAEWPGETDEVVMIGGHLDSATAGPGLNDNGSGSAAILELAEGVAAADLSLRRGIRFGFWGAEEAGLLGSAEYVEGLSAAERDQIVAYLNVDMIGSTNGVRFVYDPAVATEPETVSPGSEEITGLFDDYFTAAGLPTEPVWTDYGTDDASFGVAGIAVGGLFTGASEPKSAEQAAVFGGVAGAPTDACYHLDCDNVVNVDVAMAVQMTEAYAAVLIELAEPGVPTSVGVTPVATPIPAVPNYVC